MCWASSVERAHEIVVERRIISVEYLSVCSNPLFFERMSQLAKGTAELFCPEACGFVLLPKVNPQGIRHYELNNHAEVNGVHDFARLNVYLTWDDDFVNIWYGPVDCVMMRVLFEKQGMTYQSQDEKLFRGYISSKDQADVILSSLRYDKMQPCHYILDESGGLVCATLG